jgi:hypothetical protein
VCFKYYFRGLFTLQLAFALCQKKQHSCFGDDFDTVLCFCDAVHTPYVLVRTSRSFPSTNFTDNGQSANGIEPHTFTASPLISFPSSHPSALPYKQWYWQASRFLLSELGEGPERPPSHYGNTDLNGLLCGFCKRYKIETCKTPPSVHWEPKPSLVSHSSIDFYPRRRPTLPT